MKENSITIIAPGHNEHDQRVNRVIYLAATRFGNVNVVYERRVAKFNKTERPSNVSCFYVDNTNPFLGFFPRISRYLEVMHKYRIESKNIYIHDSGIVGLLIAKALRDKYNEQIRIIFDYHDQVKWEVHYQVSKVFPGILINKIIGWALIQVVRMYLRSNSLKIIDGIVGISESQINELLVWIGADTRLTCVSIPNTRPLLNISNEKLAGEDFGDVDLLWVGNIVDGRDLPETICCLDELHKTKKFNLYIFGNIISNRIFDEVCTREYVRYMGSFSSDLDMLGLVKSRRLIGLFFGWDDKWDTGINEISSPNKIFTYINIGVPVIIHSKVNPAAFNVDAKLGKTFESTDDFLECYLSINKEYTMYKTRVLDHRCDYLWDHDLNRRISFLFDEIYK